MLEKKKSIKKVVIKPHRAPSAKAQHYLDLDAKYVNPVLDRYTDIVAVKGAGFLCL